METEENNNALLSPMTIRASRAVTLQKWSKIWNPFDSRLRLDGVITTDGAARAPKDRTRALAAYWRRVFDKKDIDSEEANNNF
jgi:hypothetical protein